MKKIAIVAQGLGGGGAERVACILANQLQRHSFRVLFLAVYSDKKEYSLDEGVCCRVIPWRETKTGRMITRSVSICREVRAFQADLIISFLDKEMLWTSLFHIPTIYSMRNSPEHILVSQFERNACRYLYSHASAVVFQTQGAKRFFSKKIQSKSCVIANPISSGLPYWDQKHTQKRIITASRLTEQKNLSMLLKGFARFHREYPEYELMICGEGELRIQLTALAEDLQIAQAVSFPGFRKDIHTLVAESAMFAMTSDYEGLSNAMLEALAIGIPTVCTDCPPGGAAEYIENGVNGFLVPVGDEEALAACFRTLAQDAELCRRVSDAAVRIRGVLSEEKVFSAWKQLIEKISS